MCFTGIEGMQKSKGVRNNSFNFCGSWFTPSISLVLSEIPIAISPPSAFANATIEIANALGVIRILLKSNVWSSLRVIISSIVLLVDFSIQFISLFTNGCI